MHISKHISFVIGVPRGKKTKDLALALGTPYLHVNRASAED
jgi:hypothetical protein